MTYLYQIVANMYKTRNEQIIKKNPVIWKYHDTVNSLHFANT